MSTKLRHGTEAPAERRGTRPVTALGGFAALVAVSLVVIVGLVTLARTLQRVLS